MTRSSSILRGELQELLAEPHLDLAAAALVVARIEDRTLDPSATVRQLDRWAALAQDQLNRLPGADASLRARLEILNRVLYVDAGLDGNRAHYNDFRNSLFNLVERRLGIPISLALVYMEVARRCGIEMFGVSFPGHFLVRVPDDAGRDDAVILDPFNGGREMNESDCLDLLQRHLGDNAQFELGLLRPCSGRQMLARMLNNLKRVYIELRSFPQAHLATDLLLTVEPTFGSELRDRGLIAYHLDHYAAALRDLEQYMRLRNWSDADRDEHQHVQDHVKTLRAKLAELN